MLLSLQNLLFQKLGRENKSIVALLTAVFPNDWSPEQQYQHHLRTLKKVIVSFSPDLLIQKLRRTNIRV